MKKFSVVIPAFNEERFIRRAVLSAIKQSITRNDYEIIVVDNNSADKTSEIAKEAGADKVILEKEKGTNIARQTGVNYSSGKIIAFLDADCEAPQNWLSHIEKNLSKKGVFATSGPYDHDFTGINGIIDHIYTQRIMPMLPSVLYQLFGEKAGVIQGGNFALHRRTLDAIGGLPPLAFYGDDAATAMLLARNIGNIFFDRTLLVKSSPRRYEENLLRPALKYALEYFKVYFSKEYTKKILAQHT